MSEKRTFRLFKSGREVVFEVVSELHWKVVAESGRTGFLPGDEVAPARVIPWREAKRRVNSARTALSPNMLVLLRGEGHERSPGEVEELLHSRPWDPDLPPAA